MRTKFWACDQLSQHNQASLRRGGGVAIMLDAPCLAHILATIASTTFDKPHMLPRLHSVAFTLNDSGRYTTLQDALQYVVSCDLAVGHGFHLGQRPSADHAAHSRRVLEFSLLRHRHTCGSTAFTVATGSAPCELDALITALLDFFNGDWRAHGLQHFCWKPGCCAGRSVDVCRERALTLLNRSVFQPLSQSTPSAIKWASWGPAVELASLGMHLHGIIQRVGRRLSARAAPADDAAPNPLDPQSMWRDYCSKKAKQAMEFMCEPSSPHTVLHAAIVSEPIDRLKMTLQSADEAGHALAELCFSRQQQQERHHHAHVAASASAASSASFDGDHRPQLPPRPPPPQQGDGVGAVHRAQQHLFLLFHSGHAMSFDRTSHVLPMLEHLSIQPPQLNQLLVDTLYISSQAYARLNPITCQYIHCTHLYDSMICALSCTHPCMFAHPHTPTGMPAYPPTFTHSHAPHI